MIRSRRLFPTLLLCFATSAACGDAGGSDESPVESTDAADATSDPGVGADASDFGPDAGAADEGPRVLGVETLADFNDAADIVEVELHARWAELDIGIGEPLALMTYNGQFPGPLLEANVGDTVIVDFLNGLDEPTTVHWHGLRIPDAMDGNPRIQDPVQPGESFRYEFVVPEAGTFWYHPHVRANEQVERGLYGPIIVRGPEEPVVPVERVIIVDDMLLSGTTMPPFLTSHMEEMHGRLGNLLVGNGTADPQPNVDELGASRGSVERWRIINTSNARTFSLSVDGGADWRVVGVDGGSVTPYASERIQVAVGQRYDLEVVHGDNPAADLTAHVISIDENENLIEVPIPVYMVNVSESGDGAPATVDWPSPEPVDRPVDREVTIEFDGANVGGRIEWTMNGEADPAEPLFTFQAGETVHMRLVNLAGPEHPFHLHGQFFEIIDAGTPETSQPGLKDSVLVPGQSTVEIVAYMDNPGRWMAHCHILEHAELGMMSEIIVEP